jgi:hypothetical protein
MDNLKSYQQVNNNNLRKIEINEYYSQRNQAYVDVFKTIIIGIILLAIVSIFDKSNIIPQNITSTITIILVLAIVVISGIKILNINSRDTRNFNHIKIPFDVKAEELEDAGKLESISDLLKDEFGGCFNDLCCSSNMSFDTSSKKCILKGATKIKHDKDSIGDDKDDVSAINNTGNNSQKLLKNVQDNKLGNELTSISKLVGS